MTVSAGGDVRDAGDVGDIRYDPYDVELNRDPYPMLRLIREQAPLYYNAEHDFYALTRYADVDAALLDHETFSSARSDVLEIIKSGMATAASETTMDEILDRFPEWEVDLSDAELSPTSTVRGWESMPAVLP